MTPEWRRVVRLIAALWFGFAFGVGAYYDIELYLGTRDALPDSASRIPGRGLLDVDPFEVLGLPATASPTEVQTRWRELARTHHPDVGGDAVEFARIAEAAKAATRLALDAPCPVCGGRGTFRHGSGFVAVDVGCGACGTTGKRFR